MPSLSLCCDVCTHNILFHLWDALALIGGGFGSAPPLGSGPPPQLKVSELLSKLVDFGMIGESEQSSQSSVLSGGSQSQSSEPDSGMETQNSQRISPPLKIPTLSFTPATLKQ